MTMGRPTKLTPEVAAAIVDLVRSCVPVTTAARQQGIAYSTIRLWRSRAEEDPESVYAPFIEDLDRAIADAEIKMIKSIHDAATSDPNHAKWLLERRWAGRWSPLSKTKVEAKVEHSGSVDISRLSEAEADALQELVAKASGGG